MHDTALYEDEPTLADRLVAGRQGNVGHESNLIRLRASGGSALGRRRMEDRAALDAIQQVLSTEPWNREAVEAIYTLVLRTGREVA